MIAHPVIPWQVAHVDIIFEARHADMYFISGVNSLMVV
jgi:hypothetical protein